MKFNMRLLIAILTLCLVFPAGVFGTDNRAIREGALPITSGFGSDHLGAYTTTTPQKIWVVNTLTYDQAATTDSRNGLTVYLGGLKQALEDTAANRVILFEVSGTIDASDQRLTMSGNNVAIYGQTAPAPGVFVKNLTVKTGGVDNLVIQHLRFAGDVGEGVVEESKDARDALYIGWTDINGGSADRGTNVILDHCTLLWAEDENLPIENVDNVIITNCLIAQNLGATSTYSKGTQAKDASNVLYYYNLLAHNQDRNPYVLYGSTVAFTNNWVYGPYGVFPMSGQGEYYLAADSNYIDSGNRSNIYFNNYWFAFVGDPSVSSEVYFTGNVNLNNSQANADDYTGVRETGATTYDNEGGDNGQFETDFKQASAADVIDDGIVAAAADATLKANIAEAAGAWPNNRITTETDLISEALNGLGRNITSVATWPTVAANTRNLDSDMAADGFNSIPSSVSADTDGDSRSDFMEWIDELTIYAETGVKPDTKNDYVNNANCIGHYMEQDAVGEDGQSGGNDLDAGSGDSAWETISTHDSSAYISSASTRIYSCTAIADAGGITLTKVTVYPWEVGSVTGKTLKVYKDTQVGGDGNALVGAPGTLIGSIAATNDWDASAVDITTDSTEFAQNELLCFMLDGADSSNYIKMRTVTDASAKLGDYQRFQADGTYTDTINEDFKIILYESAGNPPTYTNKIADFDGTDDYLFADITSLHANTPGLTGKTTFAFVLEGVDFDAFPADGADFTLLKIANVLDCVVKTTVAGEVTTNALVMRLYDGSDWHEYAHLSDLTEDTEYDIEFGWTNATNEAVIDIGTTADETRVGTRIADTGTDFDLNAPNSGNLYIGTADGSLEFFDGTIDNLSMWDSVPDATDFVGILENNYGTPGPYLTALTGGGTTKDNSDLGTNLSWTATISEAANTNLVKFDMKVGSVPLPCYLESAAGSTSVTVTCGPLTMDMYGPIELSDADLTVTGYFKDLNEIDATTLTIPSITDTDTINIMPTGMRGGSR